MYTEHTHLTKSYIQIKSGISGLVYKKALCVSGVCKGTASNLMNVDPFKVCSFGWYVHVFCVCMCAVCMYVCMYVYVCVCAYVRFLKGLLFLFLFLSLSLSDTHTHLMLGLFIVYGCFLYK